MCRLAAPAVAGHGLASLGICHRAAQQPTGRLRAGLQLPLLLLLTGRLEQRSAVACRMLMTYGARHDT
jgi:hypothetical protein